MWCRDSPPLGAGGWDERLGVPGSIQETRVGGLLSQGALLSRGEGTEQWRAGEVGGEDFREDGEPAGDADAHAQS